MFFLAQLPTDEMLQRYAGLHDEMNPDLVAGALEMMRKASLLLRQLENLFTEADLSQTRFLILMVLDRQPEKPSLRITELAERLDVSKPVLSTTVKSLHVDKFVEISADVSDARVKNVRLRSAGRAKLNDLLPRYFTIINTFMLEYDSSSLGESTNGTTK